MKQVLQNLGSGETVVAEVPVPNINPGSVLISTTNSLISSGTERMLINFGKSSLLEKAKSQPERVLQVIDKIKTDGFFSTLEAVKSKLDTPIPLGYCNVGIIKEIGPDVSDFKVGDRVISNGSHSEYVTVPTKLVAKIPDCVSNEEAAFVIPASIGLQGVRLATPTLGEYFVVFGVGLIGLLTVQILIAHGCKVLAIDFDDAKLKIAKDYGAEICNPSNGGDVLETSKDFSKSNGVDGVIITASTSSDELISQAAKISRKRGRIILIGVTGLKLNRDDFYEKELSFQVSCSYGPGRYDHDYEIKGNDYPIQYVRWTENRNFQAVLDLMQTKRINTTSLITKKYDFLKILDAYDDLTSNNSMLGLIIEYKNSNKSYEKTIQLDRHPQNTKKDVPIVDFIGAGNYASRVLMPAFSNGNCILNNISTNGGMTGSIYGKKFNFIKTTTDTDSIFLESESDIVVIATQHNTHADLVIKAINNQKHVFVEKPLAITLEEISQIKQAVINAKSKDFYPNIMVGFNRRFSPHIEKMKSLIDSQQALKSFNFTINAGFIDAKHWLNDEKIGGGRIVGEACHFIDLMRYLAGSAIASIRCVGLTEINGKMTDSASILISFKDGSFGVVNYLSNGSKNFPKERLEIFCDGKILQLDNFMKLKGYGWKKFKQMSTWAQDKGQKKCVSTFIDSVKNGKQSPIPFNELLEVAEFSIKASNELK